MAGLVALVGGDEFRPGCEEMDRAILGAVGVPRPSLLVVPTAAARENPHKAAANGVDYFTGIGADASVLMVLEPAHANDERLLAPVDAADVLYFTGGSPLHLLETLAGSLLLRKMRQALDRGAAVVGSSAGAMVLGSWMWYRGWREALAVVPGVAALPHHEHRDPDSAAKDLADPARPDVAVIGIDGRTCCFGGPNEWKVLGAGGVSVYVEGRWRRYANGEVLTLAPTHPGA